MKEYFEEYIRLLNMYNEADDVHTLKTLQLRLSKHYISLDHEFADVRLCKDLCNHLNKLVDGRIQDYEKSVAICNKDGEK